MAKYVLSGIVVLAFVVYVLHSQTESNIVVQPKMMGSSMMARNPNFKDGQYTGNVTDAFYGNVQVKVSINAGKITDVVFLDYPKDRRTSQMISNQAMPILKQEAIIAQNANVDIISGATQTSDAFRESLQSAINKAI